MNRLLNPAYNIYENDRVFIQNLDETADYAQVVYSPENAAFMLVFYTDKYFTDFLRKDSGEQDIAFVFDIGFDIIERVDDYPFNELY